MKNTLNQPTATLRRRRQALLRQLPPLKAVLRGSLIERYKRCGKPGFEHIGDKHATQSSIDW